MLPMKAALCLLLASSACMHHALANVDDDWLEDEPVQAAQTGVAVPRTTCVQYLTHARAALTELSDDI